jgi:hypothetical protein
MHDHVNNVRKSCFYHLRNISNIRRYLSVETAEILVHAFIAVKLDYWNSLIYGLPENLLSRLQNVQNAAARLITYTKKRDHITPIFKHLHWLPVQQRIKLNILLFTFKCLYGRTPEYLSDHISYYKPARQLRSCNSHNLIVPKYKLKNYGRRAISVAAPLLWNSLPVYLKSISTLSAFKSNLKTFLFKEAFD